MLMHNICDFFLYVSFFVFYISSLVCVGEYWEITLIKSLFSMFFVSSISTFTFSLCFNLLHYDPNLENVHMYCVFVCLELKNIRTIIHCCVRCLQKCFELIRV